MENQLIGIQLAPVDSGYQLMLPDEKRYTNHVNTLHASALLSLAEAATGHYLSYRFSEEKSFLPIVRRLNAEFSKPAVGSVFANVDVYEEEMKEWLYRIKNKKRFILTVPFELHNKEKETVMSGEAEWFISKISPQPKRIII
jgi:hypothetical protein